MVHGEFYKPIVAEAAKKAIGAEKLFQRIFTSHLLKDERNPKRIAGAVGFSVRDPGDLRLQGARGDLRQRRGEQRLAPARGRRGRGFRSSHAIGPCVDNNWLT